jgi:hypothetical protein
MSIPDERKKYIIDHMNEDHGSSLIAYARAFADLPATVATLTDVDLQGMILTVTTASGVQTGVRVDYPKPLTSVGEIRPVVVQMHHEAHHKLGTLYKLTSGYYTTAVKMIAKHAGPKMAKPAGVVLGSLAVGGLLLWMRRRR